LMQPPALVASSKAISTSCPLRSEMRRNGPRDFDFDSAFGLVDFVEALDALD
jgi:hypothetical protein